VTGPSEASALGFLGDLHLGGGVGDRLKALEADVYAGPKVPWYHVGDLVNAGTAYQWSLATDLRQRWRRGLGVFDTLNGPAGNHETMYPADGNGALLYQANYGSLEGARTHQIGGAAVRVVWVSPRRLFGDNTSQVIEPAQMKWLDDRLGSAPSTRTILVHHGVPRGSLKSTAPGGRSIQAAPGVPFQYSSLDSPWFIRDVYSPADDSGYKALLGRHRQVKLIVCGHAHPLVGTQDLVTWTATTVAGDGVPVICCPAPIRVDSALASIYVEMRSWGMNVWLRRHEARSWEIIERPVWRA
jgi:hypothetical protein